MLTWTNRYSQYNLLTMAELKEILKSKGLPVSGKKQDLILYLIFDEYPNVKVSAKASRSGMPTSKWLEATWRSQLQQITGFYPAINRQEI